MKIRFILIAAGLPLAFAAQASEGDTDRCLETSAKGDPHATVEACMPAAKADPGNERIREALETAKAEIARADGADHPAKLNQH